MTDEGKAEMDKVTAQQCKDIVREKGMEWLGHHRCGGCGAMVGWEFRPYHEDVSPDWQKHLGLDDPRDTIVWFNPSCDCGGPYNPGEPRSWEEFAESFNMQTPEHRAEMWERFKAGKATHEKDAA